MARTHRTLGPAAFEAYMDFADSLKNGSNDDAIDRFKYNFAVKEGYIRPARKPQFEAADGPLTADKIKDAVSGLLQAFLPHLDSEEQTVLEGFLKNFDDKVNAGENPFSSGEDDEYAVEDAGDDGECDGDNECPAGTKCVDGECVPVEEECDCGEPNAAPVDTQCQNVGKGKKGNGNKLTESRSSNLFGNADEGESDLLRPYDVDGERDIDFDHPARDIDAEYDSAFDDQRRRELDDEEADRNLDDYISLWNSDELKDYRDDGVDEGRPGTEANDADVDYDALADELLNNAGYGNMSTRNGGVAPRNQKFFR